MSELTLEQALILLDESRQHNAAMLNRLYESLGIDSSDGEIRFKWAMIAIEDVKSERNAALAQNAELMSQVAGLNKANSKLSQVESQQGRINQLEAALDCLQYAALLNAGSCENLDRVLADTLSIHNNIQDEAPAPCLRDVKAEAGRAGYQQGIHDWRMAEVNYQDFDITFASTEYAERVRAGEV